MAYAAVKRLKAACVVAAAAKIKGLGSKLEERKAVRPISKHGDGWAGKDGTGKSTPAQRFEREALLATRKQARPPLHS